MSTTPPSSDETAAPLASTLVWPRQAGSGRRIALPNSTASGSVIPPMDGRAFIAGIGGSLLAASLAAEAQQAGKVYTVGILGLGFPNPAQDPWHPFLDGMHELGAKGLGLTIPPALLQRADQVIE